MLDYRRIRVRPRLHTFYTGYIRNVCAPRLASRLIGRTADLLITYPRVTWSASLSFSVFLVSRTAHGYLAWTQIH